MWLLEHLCSLGLTKVSLREEDITVPYLENESSQWIINPLLALIWTNLSQNEIWPSVRLKDTFSIASLQIVIELLAH